MTLPGGPASPPSASASSGSPPSLLSVPRLLVLVPLRIEELALRPGGRVGPAMLAIEHIGMGLARATEAAHRRPTLSPSPALAAHLATGWSGVTSWSPSY
jgi:hypothetical protein